jgi:hypothetical protein
MKGENMRYFLVIVVLVTVILAAGCTSENKKTLVTPTQTRTPSTLDVTTTVSTSVLTIAQTIVQKDPIIGVWRYINTDGYDYRYRFNSDGTFVTSGYSPEYKQTVVLYGNWKAQSDNSYIMKTESRDPDNYIYDPKRNIFYNSKYNALIFKPYQGDVAVAS